ncbi:hypothetical protein NHX12_007142 [Muraenolepis orangiensis]|uniref:Uncharacterized protein n=1 Tax=Muraenolepis orangiensis TaxID=630683 RepID=A0A9Q0DPF3_9TELE|nr:hypothetical protein NHX12_007142 [Muraenolepis orangiensis]
MDRVGPSGFSLSREACPPGWLGPRLPGSKPARGAGLSAQAEPGSENDNNSQQLLLLTAWKQSQTDHAATPQEPTKDPITAMDTPQSASTLIASPPDRGPGFRRAPPPDRGPGFRRAPPPDRGPGFRRAPLILEGDHLRPGEQVTWTSWRNLTFWRF